MKSVSTILSLTALIAPGLAQIDLGSAASFALLAVKGINNTGTSFVNGSAGTTGHDILGFPPGILTGAFEVQNDIAEQAQADFMAARDTALALEPTEEFGEDFIVGAGTVFTPGVFAFIKEIQIAGDITLSGAGQFVFTGGSHLILANDAQVTLENGAVPENVFWVPGDATKLGNNTLIQGMILTEDRVAMNSSSTVVGHIYAFSGIVLESGTVGL